MGSQPGQQRFPARGLTRVAAASLALLAGAACRQPSRPDPLADELARWSTFVGEPSGDDALLGQVKDGARPVVEASATALAKGRRWLAAERLLVARANLAAAAHLSTRPAAMRQEQAVFEAEWARLGEELAAPEPASLDGVAPAVVRAFGEAAIPQVRIYYEASLDYGRNTMAESGLYYLEAARAQAEAVALARSLAVPSPWWSRRRPDPPRSPGPELDALEAALLESYQPPLAIDRHPEFIAASATIKEARELDAAGLRYGAALRTLQAARRVAPLTAAAGAGGVAPDTRSRQGELDVAIRDFARDLDARGGDQSLGQLFVETALASLEQAAADPAQAPDAAAAIVDGVLPVYAALAGPAPPEPPRLAPQARVTLVRWPYT